MYLCKFQERDRERERMRAKFRSSYRTFGKKGLVELMLYAILVHLVMIDDDFLA